MDGNAFVINVFRRFSDTHLPTHEDVTQYCRAGTMRRRNRRHKFAT